MDKAIPTPFQDESAPLGRKEHKAKEAKVRRRATSIPVVSLFCGSEGMDLGFEEAGFHAIVALDHYDATIETYNLIHGRIPEGKSPQFNWAILDLCAGYCKARKPSCDKCPLRPTCFFNAERLSANDAWRAQER
jgi:hypothetical protein